MGDGIRATPVTILKDNYVKTSISAKFALFDRTKYRDVLNSVFEFECKVEFDPFAYSVAQKIIEAAKASFFAGLEYCKVGYRLSDISNAIQMKAEGEGFSVIRDFVGHGVGRAMHEDPQIPNYGKPGRGPRLAAGMVFAIEPMICEGTYEVETLLNNWTVVTADGKLAAHYENTVVITDGEPQLLTL